MITSIAITNFKLYKERTVFDGLKNINILTGINGRGKSTLLHTLLLPKQSLLVSQYSDNLLLNGDYIKLGNAIDVRNNTTPRSVPVSFEYITEDTSLSLDFTADSDKSQKLPLASINGKEYLPDSMPLRNFAPKDANGTNVSNILSRITYISAERIGPKLQYTPAPNDNGMDSVGEFAPSILYLHSNDAFDSDSIDSLADIFPGVSPNGRSVNDLANYWMSRMFDETDVKAQYIEEVNAYTLLYRTTDPQKTVKPTNMGFGYSYALPIIVAGLTAKDGDILVIENPEAHLHPMAQSALGRFIVWLSNIRKIQFFIETHSEHMVNAMRVMAKREILDARNCSILFFDTQYAQYAEKIDMNQDGHLSSWPRGFFDQEEIDLDTLL